MTHLSVYRNTKDTTGRQVTLSAVIKRIRDGGRGLDEKTRVCNALAATAPKKYKRYKENNLPAVTFSGIFPPYKRKAHFIETHSGRVTLDIDGLPQRLIPDLLAELAQMPEVLLAFVSPSGLGIKVIVRVDPIPADHIEHKGAYQACLEFFDDLATEYGFEVDTSGSDCSRLCFLAHDPLAIVNENATPITWDREAFKEALQREIEERQEKIASYDNLPVDVNALDFIPRNVEYETWRNVGMAIKTAGLSIEIWREWCNGQRFSHSAQAWIHEDLQRYWGSFQSSGITWGTVVYLAKENGYVPPKPPSQTEKINAVRQGQLSPLAVYRKPVKLVKATTNALLDTLAKTQELIAKILRIDARVIGFRADTGTGKNYETENYALRGDAVLVNVPTGDLAIDLEIRMIDRLSKRGMPRENVFRRRGLMHRWNKGKDAHLRFPYDIPCIQAARCDAFRRKGGNMFKTICPECPVKHLCVEHGYLSQPERAKQALMVIMSHPDFHINPALRGFAKQYLTDTYGEQRLVVQDDVSTHALFNLSEITRERLQQMRDEWDGAFLGSFAKELLRLLEAEGTPYAIGEYLDSLTTKQKGLLNYQLTRVRMETTQADGTPHHFTMTLDEAVANGFFQAETEADIAEMPAVDKNGWTLLDQLTAFFAHYKREVDAPIAYHKGTLTFAIPPRLHPKVWKAVFMSATLDLDLFNRPFPKAHIEDLPPTAWHTAATRYQLRTNLKPLTTVYKFKKRKKKKKRKAVSLSATGEHYWRMMVDEIARTPDIKHGIITYKKVLKWKRNEEASDLSELDNIVATAHYGNLVGLDTDFQDVETLWILFAPEIPHHEIVWRAKMFFGDDERPLNYGRDENGVYLDERLQQIWENAVLAELIQAIGRSRLVRNAKNVILLTSHVIPGITDRIETRLFDEADWEIAGGLDGLDEAIAKREAFEARAAELTGENTIEDYQEVYGCSYERARQLWHEAGGQEAKDEMEAETAAQARELREQGLSLRKIADKLGTYAERIRRLVDET